MAAEDHRHERIAAVLLAVTTKDYYRSVTNVVFSVIEPHAPAHTLGTAVNTHTLGTAVNKGAVALIVGLMLPSGVMAEPKILADWELDSITAAGVVVEVGSVTAALGDSAHAKTDSNTFVFDGKAFDVGIGVTVGQALACCRQDTDVEVGSTVLGVGDIVHGVTHRVEHNGRSFAHGLSLGFALAVSFKRHFAMDGEELLAMLRELRAALADFRFELPDAVMVGAQ